MDTGNKTAFRHCRFLGADYHDELYKTFLAAFADYYINFALTEIQFQNHLLVNGVDLDRTVGCLDNDTLIGFSLNGFGEWCGKQTVYDAGTGVLPAHRREGVAESMFAMMEPFFIGQGYKQILLEVLVENKEAIGLYQKLGFEIKRELAVLECAGEPRIDKQADGIEFREIFEPDWDVMCSLSDGCPSWQNARDAVDRTIHIKTVIGAYDNDRLVGYAVFASKAGRLAQIAVLPEYSGRGIASAFISIMRRRAEPEFPLQVINSPREIESAQAFFKQVGFVEKIIQYEMVKVL